MIDYEELAEAMGDLDEDTVKELLETVMADGGSGAQQAMDACQKGMDIVGSRFESGEYFVGDLIYAGELMTDAVSILKDALVTGDGGGTKTKMILCTVKDDLHDIGKNIVRSMLEAAGFEVLDLGIDVPASEIVKAAKENSIKIVALSGVLTMAVGPRMYIAPEYETGRVEEVTEKGDIFSLGKVLWCMINGEPEDFMPSNFWFVDEYDLTKRFPGNADMIVANSIIASCLNIAPYERCTYSSLIGQIENFIAGGNMTPEEEAQYRVRVYQEKRNLELLEIKEKNRLIVNSFSQYYIKALEELLNTYPDFELIQKLYDEYRKNSKDGIDYTSVNVENNASHYLYSGTYDRIYFSINYEPARGTDRYCSITIKYTIDSWKTIRFYYSEDGTMLSDHNGVVKLMCVETLYNILNSIIMEYIA